MNSSALADRSAEEEDRTRIERENALLDCFNVERKKSPGDAMDDVFVDFVPMKLVVVLVEETDEK